MFALVDCKNFYVSVERLFQPALRGRPVVVLSNNDGCVVSRSDEAKALGIKMSQPFFELREFERTHGLVMCSSNFALYADLSHRVTTVLRDMAPRIEQYSVDESFLALDGVMGDLDALGRQIRSRVLKEVGIPVGVGIAPTKTLSKLASFASKKWPKTGGVVDLREPARQRRLLSLPVMTVDEVWGIGRKLTEQLNAMGITHAVHLADFDRKTLRRLFSVNVERTARELAGERCFELEDSPAPKKMIASTRSFGSRVFDLGSLEKAVATYATRACEKLRNQHQLCQVVQVFVSTDAFTQGAERYSRSANIPLPYPSADTRDIVEAAHAGLRAIYAIGPAYAKAGVILMDFVSAGHFTDDLFAPAPRENSARLMGVVDEINRRQGRNSIRLAITVQDAGWAMRRERMSKRFTTSWAELPVAF
ncbi:translesion error-prone DNA polymerase V subunit UmuC (plasmid) [Stutzerimonas frequens]|uniref:translesion error-prone DNA polymerase V subunit UmuC n=1 Tax=Stutzerimonas frequens TaxID=2968969 RepID=UPI002DB7037E|nr:translesion error-prone DNA polymerase V subunit UmuC [Stutzerimonas frequens]WRW29404.1 translesion error-prone DNA polymerase V subunit UmuC [Stutzerimonas frequens]